MSNFLKEKRDHGGVVIDDLLFASEQFLAGIVGHLQLRTLLGAGEPTAGDVDRRVEAAAQVFLCCYAPNECGVHAP